MSSITLEKFFENNDLKLSYSTYIGQNQHNFYSNLRAVYNSVITASKDVTTSEYIANSLEKDYGNLNTKKLYKSWSSYGNSEDDIKKNSKIYKNLSSLIAYFGIFEYMDDRKNFTNPLLDIDQYTHEKIEVPKYDSEEKEEIECYYLKKDSKIIDFLNQFNLISEYQNYELVLNKNNKYYQSYNNTIYDVLITGRLTNLQYLITDRYGQTKKSKEFEQPVFTNLNSLIAFISGLIYNKIATVSLSIKTSYIYATCSINQTILEVVYEALYNKVIKSAISNDFGTSISTTFSKWCNATVEFVNSGDDSSKEKTNFPKYYDLLLDSLMTSLVEKMQDVVNNEKTNSSTSLTITSLRNNSSISPIINTILGKNKGTILTLNKNLYKRFNSNLYQVISGLYYTDSSNTGISTASNVWSKTSGSVLYDRFDVKIKYNKNLSDTEKNKLYFNNSDALSYPVLFSEKLFFDSSSSPITDGSVLSKFAYTCYFNPTRASIFDKTNNTITEDGYEIFTSYNCWKVTKSQPKVRATIKYNGNNTTYMLYEDTKAGSGKFKENEIDYHDKLYELLNTAIDKKAKELINEKIKTLEKNKSEEKASEFKQYMISRFNNSAKEEDYFYVTNNNKKHIPTIPFIDVEFRVPEYVVDENGKMTGEIKEVWIPVTGVAYKEASGDGTVANVNNTGANVTMEIFDKNAGTDSQISMFASDYFDSFELEDSANGAKTVTLTLKSPNDFNLEKIIYQSLYMDTMKVSSNVIVSKGTNINTNNNGTSLSTFDLVKQYLESRGNFRVRFGYRDTTDANTAIICDSIQDSDFISRTKLSNILGEKENVAKPVLVYPWTYFKIKDLSADVISNQENVFTITGYSSSSYLIDNLCIGGANIELEGQGSEKSVNKEYLGTPNNAIATIAKMLIFASQNGSSSPRICILGNKNNNGETNKIISGVKFNNEGSGSKLEENYQYKLKSGCNFRGSDLDINEQFFITETGKGESARKFNITTNENESYITIRALLNKLVDWLPERYYFIYNNGGTNYARYLPFSTIDTNIQHYYENVPHKLERMTYQIYEADAKVWNNGDSEPSDYVPTYFIRLYYEGPQTNENQSQDYLRIYNYQNVQNSVVTNANIGMNGKGLTLGNYLSSVSVLGSTKTPALTFLNNSIDNIQSKTAVVYETNQSYSDYLQSSTKSLDGKKITTDNKDNKSGIENAFLTTNNVIFTSLSDNDNIDYAGAQQTAASAYFTAMSKQAYTGSITIMGDPFYYFDSTMEPSIYEIYLNMNKVEDLKNAARMDSYFSGLYKVKKIVHNINSSGEFTTTLDLYKYWF